VNPTDKNTPVASEAAPGSFARATFIDNSADDPVQERQRWLLRLLLAQDGSTTRLCQAIATMPLTLQVRRQTVTDAVPGCVRDVLPGERFIYRVTSLAARGQVMMDNLVYVAPDGLPEPLRAGLDSGAIPIGTLLESLWVRRKPLPADVVKILSEQLWAEVGLPDPDASRAYTIATPGGNLFVIAETYRQGMRMNFDAARPGGVPGG
jgi:chorismate-pyruvate lyase